MSVIRRILNSTKALVSNSLPTTGSNTFVGTQTYSGSIIPATNNTYDLGSETKQFRHLYLSSGSLYIDGQKVLGSTGNELQITTDNGQSIKILEAGSDNIILQTADGNIELKTSGGGDVILDPTSGVIGVKGTMTIYSGNKLLSSDGNAIQFGNDLGITGSITTTGNVNGVNLSTLSSSLDTRIVTEKNRLNNIESVTGSYETKGRGIVSGSSQITGLGFISSSQSINTGSLATTGSNTFTGTQTISASLNVSGSSNFGGAVVINDTNMNLTNSSSLNLTSGSGIYVNSPGIISGSISGIGNVTTYSASINSQLSNLNGATSSYETKGRSIVSGSSQVTLSSTTGYGSVLNQSVLTTSTPTFAGATINGNLQLGNVVGGTATAAPITLNLGSTFGNNVLGKNLKIKTYDSNSGDNYIYGIGVSSNLFEITTANDGQIAFFKNGTTPTEMARINNNGQLTLPYQPAFYAWVSGGNNTQTTGAFTSFTSTRVNRGNHYNTSNGRFTAPIAGVYQFTFSLLWRQSTGNGSGEISIGVNGANVGNRGLAYSMSLAGGDYHNQTIARVILNLSAGDYVTGWIHSVGDGTANWYFGENLGHFSGHLLG
jgi:hypothetical protein